MNPEESTGLVMIRFFICRISDKPWRNCRRDKKTTESPGQGDEVDYPAESKGCLGEAKMRVGVVGDIHGSYYVLKQAVKGMGRIELLLFTGDGYREIRQVAGGDRFARSKG